MPGMFRLLCNVPVSVCRWWERSVPQCIMEAVCVGTY